MPTKDLAKQAEAVRHDIAQLETDLTTLLSSIGGAIGTAIGDRIRGPLSTLTSHVDPLLKLLGGAAGELALPARRGPGRPKSDDGGAAPKKRGRRRGGRGRKLNLTPEAIQAALAETGGNKSAAAKSLGVSQPTFYKYLAAAKPADAPAAAKKRGRSSKSA